MTSLPQRTEELILNQLIFNKEYYRKVYPHIKSEYFQDGIESNLFDVIKEYSSNYSSSPSTDTISLLINKKEGISDDKLSEINEYISELLVSPLKIDNNDFIIDETEKFCQDKAITNAIVESMSIVNGENDKKDNNAIPDLMKEALKISFDNNIGLDYNDVEERYNRLHEKIKKVPFDVKALNIITNGGLEAKTLNALLGMTGIGKTLLLCHFASSAISAGKDVLYITMEMREEKIGERIDANLMDIELDDFPRLKKDIFLSKFKKVLSGNGFLSKLFKLKKPKLGRLFIKEYPTGTPNVNNFRFLMDDLRLRKDFMPDLVIIDYINICSSARVSASAGSYTYVKYIAEELRGMAIEYNLPILTATQTTRSGYDNSDVKITDTSESIGLPEVLDLYIAIMTNDILEKSNRIAFKQLKNRYKDKNKNKYFILGVDKPKMRIYHVDEWNKGVENGSLDDLKLVDEDIYDNFDIKNKQKEKNSDKFEAIKI